MHVCPALNWTGYSLCGPWLTAPFWYRGSVGVVRSSRSRIGVSGVTVSSYPGDWSVRSPSGFAVTRTLYSRDSFGSMSPSNTFPRPPPPTGPGGPLGPTTGAASPG